MTKISTHIIKLIYVETCKRKAGVKLCANYGVIFDYLIAKLGMFKLNREICTRFYIGVLKYKLKIRMGSGGYYYFETND